MSIQIQKIDTDRSETVAGMFLDYLKDLRSKGLHYDIDEDNIESFVMSRIRSRAILSLAAVEDEKILGIVFASIARISGEYLIMNKKITGYVNDVYVLPEERGRGIAWSLINEAEKWFAEMGADSFEIHIVNGNKEAAAFWESYGLEPVSACYFKKI